MTKKKRELIEILLDNVNPEDWPEIFPYAAQDKSCSMVYVYANIPYISSIYGDRWECGEFSFNGINIQVELCKFWNKTIVHRDEFMKRWADRNAPGEAKTPQQLALEKFGTDWHENEGVPPECNAKIDIEYKCGSIDVGVFACDISFCKPYRICGDDDYEVTRWRIHSDQVALLREPMPPCSEEIPCSFVDEKSPLSTQIGGDHYTKLAIQPMQYSMKNGLDALQHTIIKYVTRFRDKAGIEDLEKAKHCIDMLIEFERGKNDNNCF